MRMTSTRPHFQLGSCVLTCTAAIVLLLAAALKYHLAWTTSAPIIDFIHSDIFGIGLIVTELFVGQWLLTGFYSRFLRLAGCCLFSLLSIAALSIFLSGAIMLLLRPVLPISRCHGWDRCHSGNRVLVPSSSPKAIRSRAACRVHISSTDAHVFGGYYRSSCLSSKIIYPTAAPAGADQD